MLIEIFIQWISPFLAAGFVGWGGYEICRWFSKEEAPDLAMVWAIEIWTILTVGIYLLLTVN